MSVLRRKPADQNEIAERIREALDGVAPLLGIASGAVTLVRYEDGVAVLRLDGDCPDCTMSVAHFKSGIEAHVKRRVPEVVEVRTTAPADSHGSHTAG